MSAAHDHGNQGGNAPGHGVSNAPGTPEVAEPHRPVPARQRRATPATIAPDSLHRPTRSHRNDSMQHAIRTLTDRDRAILEALHEHRVLTTENLCDLFFDNINSARHRLSLLYRRELLCRFQPYVPGGGPSPYHYVLDSLGADLIALDHGREPGRWRRDKALAIARSQRLDHLVTLNGFYAALVGHARRNDGCQLVTFLNERRCVQWVGEVVRPDAYGVWREDDASLDFFLEVDRGTESLDRLAAKLDRYADLEQARGESVWVLFVFHSVRRECNARRVLARPGVPVAAGVAADRRPWSDMWLPLGEQTSRRLIDLAGAPKPAEALHRAATGGGQAWRYKLLPHYD